MPGTSTAPGSGARVIRRFYPSIVREHRLRREGPSCSPTIRSRPRSVIRRRSSTSSHRARENRTSDQVFGDLGSFTQDNADPAYDLLSAATPATCTRCSGGRFGDRFFPKPAYLNPANRDPRTNVNDHVEKGWVVEGDRGRPVRLRRPCCSRRRAAPSFSAAQKKKGRDQRRVHLAKNYGEPIGTSCPTAARARRSRPAAGGRPIPPLLDKITDLPTTAPACRSSRRHRIDAAWQINGDPVIERAAELPYVTPPEDRDGDEWVKTLRAETPRTTRRASARWCSGNASKVLEGTPLSSSSRRIARMHPTTHLPTANAPAHHQPVR